MHGSKYIKNILWENGDVERGLFKTGGNSEGLPQIIVWAHKH